MEKDKVLITAALPYANGAPHFGHMVGNFLPADCFSRFSRLLGKETLFVCGSDEYGVAITLSAQKANTTAKEHADHYHHIIKSLLDKMCIKFDCFSRTTNEFHEDLVQDFFSTLLKKGSIKKRETEQLYSEKEKQFLADRYVLGTCPKCKYEKARGDECPSCSHSFEATDLINPVSLLTGSKLVLKKTDHWFFECDQFKEKLADFLKTKKWKNNVLEFSKAYLKELRARCISRDGKWGVKLPLKEADGKVLYVWFDAPLGYISASMQYSKESGDDYRRFWCDPNTKYVQFMGKDNIFFHSLFFPAMIMAYGGDYKQVDDLVANEFLLLEGKQFSKSSGWTIDLASFLEEFDSDATRFALMSNAPENHDADFRWQDFRSRVNQDLVGKFANFIHRSLTFVHNFMDQKIPQPFDFNEMDSEFDQNIEQACHEIKNYYNTYQIRKVCSTIMHMSSLCNAYFDGKKPWVLVKEKQDFENLSTTLHLCIKAIRLLALVTRPIMPNTSEKIFHLLGENFNMNKLQWQPCLEYSLTVGRSLPRPVALFEKIEASTIENKKESLLKTLNENTDMQAQSFEPVSELIDFEDFEKLDIRVAKVISVEKVKKSSKLLKFELDLGFEKRTVISGLAKHYKELDSLIDTKVALIVNLKPIKIMGIESQGMILSAGSSDSLEMLEIKRTASGKTIK